MLSKKEYAAENSDLRDDADNGDEQYDDYGDENYEDAGNGRYEEEEKSNEYEKNEGDSNYQVNDSKQEKEVIKNRKWQWATPLIEGVPPSHRGGHTATLSGASIIIFGVNQDFLQVGLIINAIGTLLRWEK